mgnify:CR=1 FL=1
MYLVESGNTRFKDTVHELDSDVSFTGPVIVPSVYLSKAVQAYRFRLHRRVRTLLGEGALHSEHRGDMDMDKEEKLSVDYEDHVWPWAPSTVSPPPPPSDSAEQNNTTTTVTSSAITLNTSTPITVTIAGHVEGVARPMGMTLTKESGTNRAFVSKLVRGGIAHKAGVRVQDYIEVTIITSLLLLYFNFIIPLLQPL